jgi:hypothetical protein
MSATISWQIQWMQCYPQAEGQTDVVFTVGWQCAGVQDTYSASVYSTCAVPAPSGSGFTPYAQLTQSQVLGWIWANGVNQAATEAAVQQQINNQINPPVVQPALPWATA